MKFAEILQKLMRENDMSNYKLAKEIGCSQSTVANWLSETVFPQKRAQKQLCEVFGVSNDYLLGLTPEQQLEDAEAELSEVSSRLDSDPDNFELQSRYDVLKEQIEDLKISMGLIGAKKDPSAITDEEADEEKNSSAHEDAELDADTLLILDLLGKLTPSNLDRAIAYLQGLVAGQS